MTIKRSNETGRGAQSHLLMALIAIVALFAASCGSDLASETTTTTTEAEAVETTVTPSESEDIAEEETTTEAPATTVAEEAGLRIVSLNPTATEMLFAIGAGDQVVAVDAFSYYPPEAPVTDLSGWEPNVEAIAGFEPNLVVSDAPIEGLDALGIDNLVLSAATNLDDIYAQISQLGGVTGTEDGAAALNTSMQADIEAAIASITPRETPLSYYHELDNTLYSVTSSTFIGYVYGLFGLENIADAADPDGAAFGYPQLNEEILVTANPDIIFLADTICCEQTAETVAARPGWDQLTAVQQGNVVELNDDVVSRWGPRIVEFIEAVGAAVNEIDS